MPQSSSSGCSCKTPNEDQVLDTVKLWQKLDSKRLSLSKADKYGYVIERPFAKKAVEKASNKKNPLIPPNSMISQFTAVLGTAFLG